MEEVDWFGAPDAEYWCDGQFFKIINGDWYFCTCHDTSWRRPAYASPENFSWWGNRVVRPVSAEWNGFGLPPVGTVCDIEHHREWMRCEIVAHKTFPGLPGLVHAIAWIDKDTVDQSSGIRFRPIRPIRTPDQIAAEERESHINAMLCHAALGGTRRGLAEALYDAGYRKTEGSKNE